MNVNATENHTNKHNEIQKERRNFLKKSVYSAPVLIVLGQLARPTHSNAWGQHPPSDPRVP